MFIDTPYYDQPYPHYQPSPTNYSPLFEEKVQQAPYPPPLQTNLDVDRFAQFQQIIIAQQQSIDKLIDQTDHD